MLRIGFIGEVQKNSCKVGFPYNLLKLWRFIFIVLRPMYVIVNML